MRKNGFTAILTLIILGVLVIGGILYFSFRKPTLSPELTSNEPSPAPGHSICLQDGERVEYPINKDMVNFAIPFPASTSIDISIKNDKSSSSEFVFPIDNIYLSGHPIEIRKCGIYLMRQIGWDQKKFKPLSNFDTSLWKYSYDGSGKKLILLSNMSVAGIQQFNFLYEFRIDPLEKYFVLENSAGGVLVFLDMQTLQQPFSLSVPTAIGNNPDLDGNLELGGWSNNGQYFWADTFETSHIFSYIVVNTKDWSFQAFPPPIGTRGGDLLDIEKWVSSGGKQVATIH